MFCPTAAGEGERDTEQISPAAQWNAADEVGHNAVCCSHRLETEWKQSLSKGSTSLPRHFSLSPNSGSKCFNRNVRKPGGSRERREILLLSNLWFLSQPYVGKHKGILVALSLPENITNSNFCQANKVPWAEPVKCLAVCMQKAACSCRGGGRKSKRLLCQVSL